MNGFSPVWTLLCLTKSPLKEGEREQGGVEGSREQARGSRGSSNVTLNAFSPMRTSILSPLHMKEGGGREHVGSKQREQVGGREQGGSSDVTLNGFSPVCTLLCRTKSPLHVKEGAGRVWVEAGQREQMREHGGSTEVTLNGFSPLWTLMSLTGLPNM